MYNCKQATKQHKGICLFTSIIKDQTAKARSLRIKCVSLRGINFDGFSTVKLYQQRISCLHVVMKKIYNFLMKSELPKFTLPLKISWFIFLQFPGWKWKICRDQSRLTFSSCGFAAWFRALTWACSQDTFSGNVILPKYMNYFLGKADLSRNPAFIFVPCQSHVARQSLSNLTTH